MARISVVAPRLALAGLITAVIAGALVVIVLAVAHDNQDAFADSRPPAGLAERFYPPANWAWGLIRTPGGPVQRYGVAAPEQVSKGAVLILPDYGESAETWFETARDLTGAGFTVWVLEGVGQGGSARLAGQRDLGDVKSFDPDVAAVSAMIDLVIRPTPERPLAILGQGVGALVAARAVETGAPSAALILSAPDCRPAPAASLLVSLGLGDLRAPGAQPWRRDGPDDLAAGRTHDPWRGAVTHAWQLTNPDLRLGGPSLGWQAAFGRLQTGANANAGQITLPTLILAPEGRAACVEPPGAATQIIPGADPALELEDDARRSPWLDAIRAFLLAKVARPPPQPTPHAP